MCVCIIFILILFYNSYSRRFIGFTFLVFQGDDSSTPWFRFPWWHCWQTKRGLQYTWQLYPVYILFRPTCRSMVLPFRLSFGLNLLISGNLVMCFLAVGFVCAAFLQVFSEWDVCFLFSQVQLYISLFPSSFFFPVLVFASQKFWLWFIYCAYHFHICCSISKMLFLCKGQ